MTKHFPLEQTQNHPSASRFRIVSSNWFWYLIVTTIIVVAILLDMLEKAFIIRIAQYIIGSLLVFFIPGYCIIRVMYPQSSSASQPITDIERIGLSVAISVVLVPFVSLMLDAVAIPISTETITLTLAGLVIIFATIAVLRENLFVER